MSSRPKALVVLTPAFPGDEAPVNWVTTQQLFVRMLKERYRQGKVIVLSFYYPYSSGSYHWHGIPVTGFDGTNHRKLRRPFFWRSIWKELNAIRRDNDLVGLFSFWCGECALIGHWYGKRYSIAHYCWLCGQDARSSNQLVKFIRPRPGELIAMSDFLTEEFERNHGIRPSHMIPNGIDPREFPPETAGQPTESTTVQPTELTAGETKEPPANGTTGQPMAVRDIDILGVGTLSCFKQYTLFPRIIQSLRTDIPEIRGLHCGEGEDRETIEKLIDEADLSTHFTLLGEIPHKTVLGLMQRTRLLLHTSDYEGFGVVCLEALNAGAHVISFVRPMNQDIPNWHVVGTVEEMIDLARKLLLSPDTKYRSVCPFLMEDTVRSVLKLFEVMGQNISYHDQAADSYDETMEKDPTNNIVRQRVKEKLSTILPSGRVLDFGGGTGQDLEWLTAKSYEVLFCEPSEGMRKKAKEYNAKFLKNENIIFLSGEQSDFSTWQEALPFPQQCDAVLSDFGALNYIPDINLLFHNMALVVRPGGHFLLLILHLPLIKRWRWHRRNAIRSLLLQKPYVMYIPYERTEGSGNTQGRTGEGRQTVFVHTLKEIKKAAAPYFRFCEEQLLEAYDFTLIHLVRNEKQN